MTLLITLLIVLQTVYLTWRFNQMTDKATFDAALADLMTNVSTLHEAVSALALKAQAGEDFTTELNEVNAMNVTIASTKATLDAAAAAPAPAAPVEAALAPVEAAPAPAADPNAPAPAPADPAAPPAGQ